eukprot:540644-Pyramimonas_sp.AAC.1
MQAMGIPRDAVNLVEDLYKGASITVRTRKGDTPPIPVMGRGTVQGDTLSPLLFILFVEPLLKWLRREELHYQFATRQARPL